MNANLNKGNWRKMENDWREALKNGRRIAVEITPEYIGNSTRPTRFNVKYSFDGEPAIEEFFVNSPEGE